MSKSKNEDLKYSNWIDQPVTKDQMSSEVFCLHLISKREVKMTKTFG